MVPTPIEALTEDRVLLLKTVQAEDIFQFGGQRDQGVQGISNFENSELALTPEGLPAPASNRPC